MRFDRLIDALDEIRKQLAGPGNGKGGAPVPETDPALGPAAIARTGPDDSPTIGRLTAGFEALSQLRPRLAALVEEHSEWQWLDAQFAARAAGDGHPTP
jgi:hypothetical protein